jgi:hypothetical protein
MSGSLTPAPKDFHMQNISSKALALAAADQIVSERFSYAHGVTTFAKYLDFLDYRTTAHLAGHLASRVKSSSGKQRRLAIVHLAKDDGLVISIPLNDPRTNEPCHVIVDFPIWLDLMESGADGAWFLNHKSLSQKAGQVRCGVPFKGSGKGPNLATVARIICNAKHGQQARLHDRNPLNLRRTNIFVLGQTNSPEGGKGRAKTDTRLELHPAVKARAALAGSRFDYERDDND